MMDITLKPLLTAGFLLLASMGCSATAQNPADVAQFQKAADQCQYLTGEWDSSLPKERQKHLEAEINSICGKAKSEKEVLLKKYASDSQITDVLNAYDF